VCAARQVRFRRGLDLAVGVFSHSTRIFSVTFTSASSPSLSSAIELICTWRPRWLWARCRESREGVASHASRDFEWVSGYGDRFGIVYVAFKTQKRTPKLSALWFREAARRNAVV
jgi:Glycosyl hydrolase family 1